MNCLIATMAAPCDLFSNWITAFAVRMLRKFARKSSWSSLGNWIPLQAIPAFKLGCFVLQPTKRGISYNTKERSNAAAVVPRCLFFRLTRTLTRTSILPAPLPTPLQNLLQSETVALLGEALTRLGESYREIIELRYFADLSYDEIATTLQLHPKTVSSRLSKALDKLEEQTRRLLARKTQISRSSSQHLRTLPPRCLIVQRRT